MMRIRRIFIYFIAIVIMFLVIVQLSFFGNAHNWWGIRNNLTYKVAGFVSLAGIVLIQIFRAARITVRLFKSLFVRTPIVSSEPEGPAGLNGGQQG